VVKQRVGVGAFKKVGERPPLLDYFFFIDPDPRKHHDSQLRTSCVEGEGVEGTI
jgi:hypothetical protein